MVQDLKLIQESRTFQLYLHIMQLFPGKNYSIEFSVQDFEIIENVDILPFDSWNPVKEKNFSKANIYNMNTSFPEEIASVSRQ